MSRVTDETASGGPREGSAVLLKGRDHIVVAVGPAALLLWAFHSGGGIESDAYLSVPVAAALGAIAPDIDHPKALIGNGIPAELLARGLGVLLLILGVGWYVSGSTSGFAAPVRDALERLTPVVTLATVAVGVGLALLLTSFVASRFLPHRGPTHSLIAALAATLAVGVGGHAAGLSWVCGFAFGWGYVSHLMTDLPSRAGLPWLLWPFVRRE